MARPIVLFWKEAPFLRLFIPLAAGICVQYYFPCKESLYWTGIVAGSALMILYFFLPFFRRYQLIFLNGIAVFTIFFSLGALLNIYKDVRHHSRWMGNQIKEEQVLIASLVEEPVEKTRSYKSIAKLDMINNQGNREQLKGKINIYFKKDSLSSTLHAGCMILFKKPLRQIRNSGNPGSFDFKRFSLFRGITHQVYLDTNEYIVLPGRKEFFPDKFLQVIRGKILSILRNNIQSDKELGLAEALLIGYKDDLDPELVQAYANSGVVHIIAISGLHLGLIYWLLLRLFNPLQKKKRLKYLKPICIICILWLFSLLAGGQPSVLRSALMFSCIVLGENLGKRNSIYNTLACSAFILLCINPFWLWDLGFQLSYSAILGIVVFMRPIYQSVYFRNKLLDHAWKGISVALAAQLLSLPFCIYYFHQFPNYFLITNLVAVPFSSFILLGEILLCIFSFIPFMATMVGSVLEKMIRWLNEFIERMDLLPFSIWEGIQISVVQAFLVFLITISGINWFRFRTSASLKLCLLTVFFFFSMRSISLVRVAEQAKIIVYDIPHHRAIDFIQGGKFFFSGDAFAEKDAMSMKYNLKPSRLLNRVTRGSGDITLNDTKYISFANLHILLLDSVFSLSDSNQKQMLDLVVLSGKAKINIAEMMAAVNVRKFVFDSSVPPRKLKKWKMDCESLKIPHHDINEKGAFVMSFW